jgi:hypothetical protein
MAIWKNCRMDSFYYDRAAIAGHPCEVRIDGTEIVVSYKWDGEWVSYNGSEVGEGDFELTCDEKRGHAYLYRRRDSAHLDGYWMEDGERGMWRITLDS